jgi:outer membrane protein assembly factor BamD
MGFFVFRLLFFFTIICYSYVDSCGSDDLKVKSFYIHAINSIARGNYFDALQDLDKIQNDYHFSSYSKDAIILEAFLYYISRQYEKIDGTVEVFFKLYPNDYKNTRYLKYLNGLAAYELLKKKRLNDSAIEELRSFWNYLEENKMNYIVEVRDDIDLKISIINDIEALYSLKIGDFYQSYGEIFPAINRYNSVQLSKGNDRLKKIAKSREFECRKVLNLE